MIAWSRFVVLSLALAGCAGNAPSAADGTSGGDQAAAPDETPTLGAAPQWEVGQAWTHSWTLGTSKFDVRSIVVDNGTGYTLATDDRTLAIQHSAFFFHDLGQMDKTWSVHEGDLVFPWYSFPLSDGKTWTAHEENLDFNLQPVSRDLTLTATLVNASGGVPAHYAIESRTADGALRASYDYTPELGWFQDLALYDPTTPDAPAQVLIHTSGLQKGWTGTYYQASSDFALNYFTYISPVGGQVQPQPTASFTVKADATDVFGFLFSFAAGGTGHAEVVAPDGQHWEAEAVADQNGNNLYGNGGASFLVPAVAGEWRAAVAAVSPFAAGGGAFAWAATVTTGQL